MRTIGDLCQCYHRDVTYESLVHGQQGQKPYRDQLGCYDCQYFPENNLLILSDEFGMRNFFEIQIVRQEAVCRCLDIHIVSLTHNAPRS